MVGWKKILPTEYLAVHEVVAYKYNDVETLNCKFFNSVISTMQNNYATIANYFENRSTNTSVESFNAK
ncbi:MAG: transposase [Rikenellaceae bacterium]